MTIKNNEHDHADLRKQAEEIAKNAARMPENIEMQSPEATRQMLHDLQLHQIELKMQNDELRRAQAELEASQVRYFDLYNLAPVGYFTISEKELILSANLTAATLLGIARSSMVKHPLSRFILSEDMDIYYLHSKQLLKTNEPQACEIRMLRKDAAPFWARMEAVMALDADGLPICRTVMSDITERKQAEATLRESQEELAEKNEEQAWLLKSMMNAFVIFQSVLDDHGRFVSYRFEYINDAYEKITGKTLEQVRGKTVHEVWPETEASWIEKYGSVAMTGIPLTFDMHHQPTGKYYHCYAYRPWETTERFCVIFDDITERELAANENKKLQDQLAQTQKMESVGRLAGGVAHDFNNMLSIIIGYAEMTLDALQPADPLHENIREIISAGKRSTNVVRQLLAFARKQTVAPKVLNLNDTIEDTLKMLRRLIGEDIDLLWKPANDLWLVKMDLSQIEQLLANLVINARDAIKDVGKITIETANVKFDLTYCKTHSGFLPGEYVQLTVSDDGCGMDKEILPNIFEPFFTTKEVGKGTGLGLATVYGIVRQNKGFINVDSEPGKGSTFRIYLPRHQAAEENTNKTALPAEELTGVETVLMVEDEQVILKLGKIMLERLGYTVLTANTPDEAIRLAMDHAREIHLLMTDVIMPEMNGRDLARQVTALRPKIKSLFMSGYTAGIIAHHGIFAEGVHFIQKPFSIKELAVQVRKALCT